MLFTAVIKTGRVISDLLSGTVGLSTADKQTSPLIRLLTP